MGLFGGKLAEILCRSREDRSSQAGRIGHEGVWMFFLVFYFATKSVSLT